MIRQVDVLGVKVSAVDLHTAEQIIAEWIETRSRKYVCVTGVHGVMESQLDPELMRIHNSAGLTTPDGMPLVWCSRYAGADWVSRVYGPDLVLKVAERSAHEGWKHFFYGAAPGVADEMAERLVKQFPGLAVAGTHSPPFRDLEDDEIDEIARMINQSNADVVWVGLSTPKQERWMAKFRPLLDAPVLAGVGAAFDIHAGRIAQAPPWVQRSGLEWLFRLAVEPRRLWRRYMTNNPRFLRAIVTRPPRLT